MQVRVYGRPVPQGSKRVVNGRLLDVNAVELRSWRSDVACAWADQVGGQPFAGPVVISLTFFFPRPLGHYGKKGLLPSAPRVPQVRPDLDKLVRAVLDALTGCCFHDDAQVSEIAARKRYADFDPPGLVLDVQEFAPSEAAATLAAERSE
jgi:Holliday junction resolvase RusA-like endonuclease